MDFPALQPVDLCLHASRLFLHGVGTEAGLLPGLDPVRLRRITEHFHTPVDLRLICKADDLFGVLLEDVDFGTDIDLSVLPADAQDRVRMVIAEVLAVVKGVEGVPVDLEVVDFEVRQDQAAQFAPFAQAIDAIAFRVFFLAALHAAVIGGVYEPVRLIGGMMGQDVRIGLVEVSGLDPMRRADGVEGHCDLVVQVRIHAVQLAAKTVVQNVDVFGKKFRRFLAPYPDKFSVLEGDRLHLLALTLVLHAAEYDPVPRDLAFQGQGVQVDLPEAVSVWAEHSIDRGLKFREGGIAVCFLDLSDDQKVRAGIGGVRKLCYVVLGDVHGLSGTGRSLQNTIAAAPLIDRAKDWVELGGRLELNLRRRSHS